MCLALEQTRLQTYGEITLPLAFREVINDSKGRLQEGLERIRVYVQGELPDFEEPTAEQVEWATRIKDRWLNLR